MNLKQIAGEKAAAHVRDGMVVGLGTGSTVYYTLLKLGRMVRDGLDMIGIPTSVVTEKIAREQGIGLTTIEENPVIDLTIDGADEVSPGFDLIKGLGGALLREKVVASCSRREIIIVDDSKIVDKLGTRAPLPVEVIRFGAPRCVMELEKLGCRPVIRQKKDGTGTFITDEGNYILDCHFPGGIDDPDEIERNINNIPGVIENGLFLGLTDMVIVAMADGTVSVREK